MLNPSILSIVSQVSDEENRGQLRVLDIHGKEVFSKTYAPEFWKSDQKLDITDYGEEMYLVEILGGNQKGTARFIKIK